MSKASNAIIKLNTRAPFLIPILSFFIGTGILFSFTKYCGFLGDECYMTSCILDYKNSPLAVLIFFIGHCWGELFGLNLLHLRYLTQIFYLIAIGASVIYLQRKCHNAVLSSLIFILACFISNLGGFGIYNWDTGTYPFVAFFAISVLCYIDKPTLKNIMLCGVLTGLLIAARVTLALCPFLVIFVIYHLSKKIISKHVNIFKHIATYLFFTVTALLTIYFLIWGSFNCIIQAFNPDNIITGHSIADIGIFIWRFKVQFPYVCLAWGLGFLTFYFAYLNSKSNISKILFAIISILAGWSILRIVALEFDYGKPIFGLSLPYLIIPALIFPIYLFKRTRNDSLMLFKGIVIVTLVFLLGVGSDSAFERWETSFILPISIATIYPALNNKQLNVIYSWIGYSFAMFVIMICYRNIGVRTQFSEVSYPVKYNGNIPLINCEKEYLDILEPQINKLISNNNRFTFWGEYQLFFRLNFESDYSYSKHVFHYHFQDILNYLKKPETLDYIFVIYPKDDTSSVDCSINSLLNAGYTIEKKTDYYTLFKTPSHKIFSDSGSHP